MKNQKRKEEERARETRLSGEKKKAARVLLRVGFLLAGIFLLYLFYSWAVGLGEGAMKAVFWSYFGVTLALLCVYLVYNRPTLVAGRGGERLSDALPAEERDALLADAARRRDRSGWMLLLIVCFLSVFLLDYLDLFILDSFRNLSGAV